MSVRKIFNALFKQKAKEEDVPNNQQLSETDILNILAKAIADIGYWSWWATELPDVIQLEFGRTLLYFPPTDVNRAPNAQIAIQFKNPKSISFITRHETNQPWYDELHNDQMDPPSCSLEYFTFTNNKLILEIINSAKSITTIQGYSPNDNRFLSEKYKLVFWADDYGVAIAADELHLLSKSGDIALEVIPQLNADWWAYWRKYWDVKDTENALPKDFACEITIPVGKGK